MLALTILVIYIYILSFKESNIVTGEINNIALSVDCSDTPNSYKGYLVLKDDISSLPGNNSYITFNKAPEILFHIEYLPVTDKNYNNCAKAFPVNKLTKERIYLCPSSVNKLINKKCTGSLPLKAQWRLFIK
ncbi:MAG: hypothetical protein LWX54_03125 [Deltaproteobacteria bacterium]|jgi:hypothetical protein|nr:hypothetical protein [Deltaproteobacteria bacterium]